MVLLIVLGVLFALSVALFMCCCWSSICGNSRDLTGQIFHGGIPGTVGAQNGGLLGPWRGQTTPVIMPNGMMLHRGQPTANEAWNMNPRRPSAQGVGSSGQRARGREFTLGSNIGESVAGGLESSGGSRSARNSRSRREERSSGAERNSRSRGNDRAGRHGTRYRERDLEEGESDLDDFEMEHVYGGRGGGRMSMRGGGDEEVALRGGGYGRHECDGCCPWYESVGLCDGFYCCGGGP